MYGFPINYDAPVFRPPSEGRSVLLQVTLGCSNNKCTYCDMYRSKTYQVRALADILLDLKKLASYYQENNLIVDKVFLCDGDALGAPMKILTAVLDEINLLFPEVRRIGIYATAENILLKTEEELKILAGKKLTMAYLGLESGDDQVLHMIVKGNTSKEMLEASLKIKKCGFKLSTIAMLGVGGQKFSREHVINTAKILSETSPHFFSFLTTFSVKGTPYFKMIERGLISPLTSKELLQEMHDILDLAQLQSPANSIVFRANHVSNMYPLGGVLPKDQNALLEKLKNWIIEMPAGVYPEVPLQM